MRHHPLLCIPLATMAQQVFHYCKLRHRPHASNKVSQRVENLGCDKRICKALSVPLLEGPLHANFERVSLGFQMRNPPHVRPAHQDSGTNLPIAANSQPAVMHSQR